MQLLIQWVTQIIIFLILAAIIDLIVPANAMKKYVKFVVGLILILIFLKPVFYVFNIDIKQALESAFTEQFQAGEGTKKLENLIEMQKSEIESSQNAYILEQMAVQLKDIAKDPLLNAYNTEITDIDYIFKTADDYSYENLEEVVVYLKEFEEGEGTIDAVDDVVINTDEHVTTEDKDNTDEIKKLLQETWELNDKKIVIFWEGGTS